MKRRVHQLSLLVTVTACVGIISVVFAFLHHDSGQSGIVFSLTDHHGQNITQADLSGNHLLVFFGFTRCASVCPTQLARLSTAMEQLDALGLAGRFTPVLITVDPHRDRPEVLRAYLKPFHPDFVGLTGSDSALRRTASSFNTVFPRQSHRDAAEDQINHASSIYVVGPDSRLIDFISADEPIISIVQRLQQLVQLI